MIQMVDVTGYEVAFHHLSLPIYCLPFFSITLKAQYRSDGFPSILRSRQLNLLP